MILGFKRRFAPFVEEGSKTHTIRALRKDGKSPLNAKPWHGNLIHWGFKRYE